MPKFSRLLLGTTLLGAFLQTAQANDAPTTFVGPTLRGTYTGWFTENTGYSLLGEAGAKNLRLNLTTGAIINDRNRVKFSAEYLRQRLTYQFFSGEEKAWTGQYAVGGDYQYGWCANFSCFLDLNAYYSYAPGRGLGVENVVVMQNGFALIGQDNRRIAGANAFGISPGADFVVWRGGMVGFNLNYDNIRYNNKNSSGTSTAGLGGTFTLNQAVYDHLNVGLVAALRKPYNNYQASINWQNILNHGELGLGLFGGYTNGKSALANSWNAGVSLNFVDCHEASMQPARISLKGEIGSDLCITPASPYAVVPNAYTAPQHLAQRPAALGPKLPIVNATFSGGKHS